jgi:hypothetical protein
MKTYGKNNRSGISKQLAAYIICTGVALMLSCSQCSHFRDVESKANPTATWFVDARCFTKSGAKDAFEGVCVYRSISDGRYYLLPEDYSDNRYYELWTATKLSGPWTKRSEKWASRRNIVFDADHWTDNVSHGEIVRAGVNQKLEISDINRA